KKVGSDKAPVEQGRQPTAEAALTKLSEDERQTVVLNGERPAGSEGPIERFVDQTRHIAVVGQFEARVDVGFERKLAEERQTERLDRRNVDAVQPIAELAPSSTVQLGAARLFQPVNNSLAHLGRSLARKRDREDAFRIDACAQ